MKNLFLYRDKQAILKKYRENFLIDYKDVVQNYQKRDTSKNEIEYFYNSHAKDVNRRMVQNGMPYRSLSDCRLSKNQLTYKVRKHFCSQNEKEIDEKNE